MSHMRLAGGEAARVRGDATPPRNHQQRVPALSASGDGFWGLVVRVPAMSMSGGEWPERTGSASQQGARLIRREGEAEVLACDPLEKCGVMLRLLMRARDRTARWDQVYVWCHSPSYQTSLGSCNHLRGINR